MILSVVWFALNPDVGACEHDDLSQRSSEAPPIATGLEPAGSGALSPTRLPVGEKITITYTYTVGEHGMAAGDIIRLQDPIFHGGRWALWGHLSDDPADCGESSGGNGGLVTVSHTGDDDVSLSAFRLLNTPGFHSYSFTEAALESGQLSQGDQIIFTMGDTSGGEDCGLKTATRTMDQVPWVALEQIAGADWTEVTPAPTFSFVSSAPAERLLVSAPSQVLAGEPFTVRVAVLDGYGNASPRSRLLLRASMTSPDLDAERISARTLLPRDGGIWTFEATAEHEGFARVRVDSNLGDLLSATSNPILVSAEAPARSIYWGDLHTHHGHSYTDEEGEYHDQNHEYARDVVGLQVGCESTKASPHELDWEALWVDLQRTCEDYTVDGDYVALLCYEWMGSENNPYTQGHHNVYYDDCNGELAPNTTAGLTGSDIALWSFMAEVEATTGSRSISVPHASSFTGYNWRDRDDAYRPLAEVYSEWGTSAEANDAGSGVYNGLGAGHRLGMFAASDNHDGWIGNRWASFKASGGLGAFVATDLSRAGIFEAMEARSTYGTTGHRPYLAFTAEDGEQIRRMGEEVLAEAPTFRWVYAGEATIRTVELLAIELDDPEADTLTVLESWTPEALEASGEFVYVWDGVPRAVWLHAVEDDGGEAWSSPIWLASAVAAGAGGQGEDSPETTGMVWTDTGGCSAAGAPRRGAAGLLLLTALMTAIRRRRV